MPAPSFRLTPRPRVRRAISRFLPVLFVVLCLAPWRPAPARGAAPAMVVAVLYFDNNTGDRAYDVLQKGLADMLVTDLAGVPALQVVEREKLEKVIGELDLQRSRYFDPKTAQKLGQVIGARYAVTGAFSAIEPRMRIDVRLIDVATAAVVMADKVVGKKDAFFELESELVAKFVRGLDVRAKVAAGSGVRDVDALLAYSEGVDLADKGQLEQASQKLGSLVRAAPRFTLAQKKYTDVMRRLRLAKKAREAGLGEDEKILLANIERELSKKLSALAPTEARRYLGYRVARGNYHLWQARKLTGLAAREFGPVWVRDADRPALRRHLGAFFHNSETLIAEIEAIHARHGNRASTDMIMDAEDIRRGHEIGIADKIHQWTFPTPDRLARAVAEFAVLGVTPFWLSVERFSVRPSLAELDPAYAKKAFALMELARREIRAHETGTDLQSELAEITDLHAESLLRLGRREEAIAQWQAFLEQYPKAKEYQAFEAKIEDLLGISSKAQAFEAALAACSTELFSTMYQEFERMGRAEGSAGVRRLVAALEQQCARGPAGPSYAVQAYFMAGRDGALRGDCALYREMRARAAKLGPHFVAPFEADDPPTAHCR